MHTNAQTPAANNATQPWLTAADFLVFAKRIWPEAQSDTEAMERKVEELYGAAAQRYPTYDTMVHNAFCDAMDLEFGSEEDTDSPEAFAYAREAYGYESPSEREAQQEEDSENGICSHGLDYWTCPCGCFG
ncbi:hypothetical protein ACPTKS_30780 [Pseudomonas aeruginosa]|jgi:hypothetical protein|uniref:hypothetical protein n=1 Tax=Pseudomonas aeruginosa TaxID=287 RepID=UPI003CC615DB